MIPDWDDQFLEHHYIPLTEEEEAERHRLWPGIGPLYQEAENKVAVVVDAKADEDENDAALGQMGKPRAPIVAAVVPVVPVVVQQVRVREPYVMSAKEKAYRKELTDKALALQAAAIEYYKVPAHREAAKARHTAEMAAKGKARRVRPFVMPERPKGTKQERWEQGVANLAATNAFYKSSLNRREAKERGARMRKVFASGSAVVAPPPAVALLSPPVVVVPSPVAAPPIVNAPPPLSLVRVPMTDELMMRGLTALSFYLRNDCKDVGDDPVHWDDSVHCLILFAGFTLAKLTQTRVALNQDASPAAVMNELIGLVKPYAERVEGEIPDLIWTTLDYVTGLVGEGKPLAPDVSPPEPVQSSPRPEILEHDIHEEKHASPAEDVEFAAAAEEVGSSITKSKTGKVPRLVHNLSATDGKAWSQICIRQARDWTKKLRKERKENGIGDGQYDGHTITPEEWNSGGYNEFLQKRMGPDRRSEYQYFSRNQRKRVKLILQAKGLALTTKVGKRQWRKTLKSLDAVALREELAVEPKSKKSKPMDVLPVAKEAAYTFPSTAEKMVYTLPDEVEAKEEQPPILVPDEISESEVEELGEGQSAPFDVWEGVDIPPTPPRFACFACGDERDEFEQVCPTCMRAGVGLAEPPPGAKYPWDDTKGLNSVIRAGATEIQRELDSDPSSFHFYDPALLAALTRRGWNGIDAEMSPSERLVFARHMFVALLQVGVYLLNKHFALGEKLATAVESKAYDLFMTRLVCDVHSLLGFYFFPGEVASWRLMPTESEFELQGIHEPDFLDFLDDEKVEPSSKLADFLDGKTQVWKIDRGVKTLAKADVAHLREDASRFARLRELVDCLVHGLLARSYLRLGETANSDLLSYVREQGEAAISLFGKLNKSLPSRAKDLSSVCEGIAASFGSNLIKFLTTKDD